MSNIKFKLNLNKHPKDCEDYSLINAWNVRVSDDFSCLQSEESIVPFPNIEFDFLNNCKVVGVIPCNTELVIFAVLKEDYFKLVNNESTECYCLLYRYDEKTNSVSDYYVEDDNFPITYHKGKIKGTFTYNVNNELIIAFSEYDALVDVPLRTINLGIFSTKEGADDTGDSREERFAISPEINIPTVFSFEYISGSSYKGWYYYFIRYKINKHDYTRWYPIGNPIFICTLKFQNIFKYGIKAGENSYLLNGASDYFSDSSEIANESVKLNITNIDDYKYFQIGFVCVTKDSSKAFRTADIAYSADYTYEMKISECFEDSVSDLILTTYNYYNVKNIINYQNRLYISNYKEKKDPDIEQSELNKIILSLGINTIKINDVKSRNLAADENGVVVSTNPNYDYIDAHPILYYTLNTGRTGRLRLSNRNFFRAEDIEYITSAYILSFNEVRYSATVNSSGTLLQFTIDNNNYTISFRYVLDEDQSSSGENGSWIVQANDFKNQIDISTNSVFIDTNNSFNTRKAISTLLPGETYNFYIHFVDKYGEFTKGYKLNNTTKFILSKHLGTDYFPIFVGDIRNAGYDEHSEWADSYLLVPKNALFSLTAIEDYKLGYAPTYLSPGIYIFIPVADSNNIMSIPEIIEKLGGLYIDDTSIKWNNIFSSSFMTESTLLENNNIPFSYVENSKGDSFFKVPDIGIVNNSYLQYYLKFDLNGFTIPDGYVGYYFSYEKFESTKKVNGIFTKYDIFEQSSTIDNKYKKYNNSDNLTPYFYSSQFDIDDELNLDYTHLLLDYNFKIKDDADVPNYQNTNSDILNGQYPITYNKVEECNAVVENATFNRKYVSISEYSLGKANSFLDGRFGVGTALSIKLLKDRIRLLLNNNNYVRATLLKINKNIYTNENKILIKFSNIFNKNTTSGIINNGLNGHVTYQGTLIYNFNKFNMSAENVIVTEEYRPYYPCPISQSLNSKYIGENRPPVAYLQQCCYDDKFYEAKSFKNYPQALTQNIDTPSSEETKLTPFTINYIITPANSIDVFRELYTNQDKLNPKTYLAQSDTESYVYQFDKRIQRSNVIADESFANNWRSFPVEGYKDISENKGKITNLVGIGTTLLAHTEHSLFAFSRDNTIQTTNDENIQFVMPDVFDIEYKEVFTSDMGMCGLQDDKAFVVGQFGYIFYDNDSHRFYKFGERKIEQIDFGIIQFLNIYVPFHVRFAHDKERNRLLVNFYYTEKDNLDYWYTLSYNYLLKEWISFHDYRFSEAYNTKNILYYFEGLNELYDNDTIVDGSFKLKSRIYSVWQDINKYIRKITTEESAYYNKFFNTGDYTNNGIIPEVKLNFIVHSDYLPIKTIEYLTYKLFRRGSSEQNYYSPSNPRENKRIPYSGYKLEIYNEDVSTGKYISVSEDNRLDISVDSENAKNTSVMNYKKPWWELGNWNFNYLRDVLQGRNHDVMARLYGNYFIIAFSLLNPNNNINQKLEFEDLDVTIITDKTV